MGLRNKVALLLIWVIVYQISTSNCLPRRHKNCCNRSRNILHKSANVNQPSSRRTPQGKTYTKPKSSVNENVGKISDIIPEFENQFDLSKFYIKSPLPVKSCCWEIPEVPDFEKNFDLSKLCLKSPPPAKIICNNIPEIPDFENNLDLSKLCLNSLTSMKNSGTSNSFNPYLSPFGFNRKGSFPEVQYPLDVNDFRIPTDWDDFIEQKLKQQEKEINEVCKDFYEGNSRGKPKPKTAAIEKAINALIKSQALNKKSQSENAPSTRPIMKSECFGDNSQLNKIPAHSGSIKLQEKIGSTTLEENVIPNSTNNKCETNTNDLDTVLPTIVDGVVPSCGDQITLQDVTVPEPVKDIALSTVYEVAILPITKLPIEGIESAPLIYEPLYKTISPAEPAAPVDVPTKPSTPLESGSLTDTSLPNNEQGSLTHIFVPTNEVPTTPADTLQSGSLSDTSLPTNEHGSLTDTSLPSNEVPITPVDTFTPFQSGSLTYTSLPNNEVSITPVDTLTPLQSGSLSDTSLPTNEHGSLTDTSLPSNEVPITPVDTFTPFQSGSLTYTSLPNNEVSITPVDTLTPLQSGSLSDTSLPTNDAPVGLPTDSLLSTVDTASIQDDIVSEDAGLATVSPFFDEAPRVIRPCPNTAPSEILCSDDIDYFIVGLLP